MPIANVNRIVFVNEQSVNQFGTICQPIVVWLLPILLKYKQISHISIGPGDGRFAYDDR